MKIINSGCTERLLVNLEMFAFDCDPDKMSILLQYFALTVEINKVSFLNLFIYALAFMFSQHVMILYFYMSRTTGGYNTCSAYKLIRTFLGTTKEIINNPNSLPLIPDKFSYNYFCLVWRSCTSYLLLFHIVKGFWLQSILWLVCFQQCLRQSFLVLLG